MRAVALVVAITLAAGGCAARHVRKVEKGAVPAKAAWFTGARMSSGAPIPAGVLSRASQSVLPVAPGAWVSVGPMNIPGRLTAIAVDPNDAGHVWVGAPAGGVFHSFDAGATWAPVFDGQPVLNVGALAAHPTDSAIVYVGTGEANGAGYSYDGDGVHRTIDGGATWQHIGLAETRRIGRIAIDPDDPQRVFVAAAGDISTPGAHRGVYRSTNGGTTWSNVLFVAPTAGAIDLALDPSNPARIYAAIWDHHSTATHWAAGGIHSGIWRSLDGGGSWSRLSSGLPASSPSVGRIGLALAASSPLTLYALYLDDPGKLMGIYKTTDGGQNWSRQNASGAKSAFFNYGYYLGQIRVDPSNADVVYVMDIYGARSIDGGRSYSTALTGTYVDHHDLVILPDRMYLANDGGFYRSTDGGTTWLGTSGLPVTQFYDIAIDPVDSTNRFGGTQDRGSMRTVDGGTASWNVVLGGDGFQCEVDPIDPLRVYCEQQFGNIFRSNDGGATFLAGFHGLPPSDRTNWNAPLVHDPTTSQRLYTATQRMYRTIDGAANWSSISDDLTDGVPENAALDDASSHLENAVAGTITTIGVSAVNGDVVWAGTDDGNVWVTTSGGASWVQVDVPGVAEWVTRVEADPFSASAAYVTFSGFRYGSRLPRVFRTVDLGATWTDIGGDLPDVPINVVAADPDPAMRGRLFVGSDYGAFVTDDYGRSWSALSTGLPPVVVLDLDLIHPSRELFAGTHGRSMYVYDLDQLGPADADGDGADNLADCAPGDAGLLAAPGEVTGVLLGADRQTLSWDSAQPSAGSATEHQVLRVEDGNETCLAEGTPASTFVDDDLPPAGAVFWYLVRARNACGTGTYGSTSGGLPRLGAACP